MELKIYLFLNTPLIALHWLLVSLLYSANQL
uniref:Uncharacterized protein n=1 Tax=Anguilla anguilla TaxID=7936 RepID=A0A0E9PCR7_ANGAN